MRDAPGPDDSASEQVRLLAEALALDRRRKVSQAQLASLEARVQKAFDQDSQELADRLAKLKLPNAVLAPPLLRGWRLAALAVLIFLLAGAPLELSLGSNFIFAFTAEHRAAAPWLFAGSLPLSVGLFMRADIRQQLRARFPTFVIRWLLMFPMMSALMASLVVVAPLGWAALFGRIAGGSATALEARVVTVSTFSKSAKSCDQTGELLVKGALVRLCFRGRAAVPYPTAGETVVLVGRSSWFGMLVDEIQKR